MLKVIAASMVLVVVIGSGASATTLGQLQNQISQIGLTNNIDLLHGEQTASSLQNLVVENSQCATGICNAAAHEGFFAAIGEAANAAGMCALVDVAQELNIVGTQAQEVGEGIGAKAQLQNLSLVAGQGLAKSDGAGVGDALHTIVTTAEQTASNPAGDLHETSTIMGMQTSSLAGEAGATGIVTSTMAVNTTQTQGSL